MHRVYAHAADLQGDAVFHRHVGTGEGIERGISDAAAYLPPEHRRRRDVIRMNVRVNRHDELQTELVDYLQVALPSGHHRIHKGGFARFGAGDQIGVGRRHRLEELAEDGGGTDHDRAPSFSASATTAGSSVARPASRPRLSSEETPS